MNNTQKVLLVIGIITLATGGYSYFKGGAFNTYFPALLFGVILIGTPFMKKDKN